MTEVHIPKGQALTPISLPSVAWYEFILNEKLLRNHLSQENPDPSSCQLIIQFLQQAEVEMAALIQAANEQKVQSLSGAVIPILGNKLEEEIKPIEPTKKVKALRLLAVKVGCFMRWNLTAMEKGVPIPVLQALLIHLLQYCVPNVIDNIHNPDLEVSSLSELGFFVVHLFHRWCVRSVVRDSFPTRPIKQTFVPMPGQIDPNLVMAQATDTIIRKFKEELHASTNFLENCLHALEIEHSSCARMPTMECFVMPGEETEPRYLWENTSEVPPSEITCQICFDLGALYFFKSDYRKAYEKFKVCKQLKSQLVEPLYCSVDEKRLQGYLTSCSSLLGVTAEAKTPSLFERAEIARKKDFQGIVEILCEDNLKLELDMSYRGNLQEELLRRGMTDLHMNVYLCNVVRTVVEGKPLVSPILETLRDADPYIIGFLIELLTNGMKDSSATQKSNLKNFILHMIELLPQGSVFSQKVLTSDLRTYFNKAEVEELNSDDLDNNMLYLQELGMEDIAAAISIPLTREPAYNMSDIEGQLLAVYDPKLVREILTELYENRGLNAGQIISLNDKWKVPKELKQLLETVNSDKLREFDKIYLYVLIAKSRHCLDLKFYERAIQLLQVVESKLSEVSFVAARHATWQVLLMQLNQFSFKSIVSDGKNIPGQAMQCKQCLNVVRQGQDITPSNEVIEHCCVFLCNIGEWQYLSDPNNTANEFIELSRLFACLVKDIILKKNVRKPARDLWDAVLNIYQPGNSKHSGGARRDQQSFALIPRYLFIKFLQKLIDPTILSVLISLFAKLFAILKDDITSDISTEYVHLWPTAINVTLGNVSLVEDTLKLLLSHGLKIHPTQPSWLRTQADIYFVEGQHSTALKFYLEAGVVATDFFTCPVPRSIFDDVVYRRMIKCCSYLQCHTQVAVLCQYLDEPDYNTAFKSLQERNIYDAMDAYYCCIWDVSILEFLVHIHTRKGEMEKRQSALRTLSQMDLNSNNPDQIQKRAVHVRKTKFLRALAKQYLS